MRNPALTGVQQALLNAMLTCISDDNASIRSNLQNRILQLNTQSCPQKLELFGDDRTVVVPHRALNEALDPIFAQLLRVKLWESIAKQFQSQLVVRRDEIDPESPVRKSQFQILFPQPTASTSGWITVTENGIRQSFDLTRVMFSRGNITEKGRFGNRMNTC